MPRCRPDRCPVVAAEPDTSKWYEALECYTCGLMEACPEGGICDTENAAPTDSISAGVCDAFMCLTAAPTTPISSTSSNRVAAPTTPQKQTARALSRLLVADKPRQY
jgi:hypothetical protein